ncbi:unnamed protein product [Cladocopium goreaui]|uniref:Uncharacterized protein n=1 Tax=Cladocopium goreaui TaxID=2562237 RepID=A0A9P1D3V8_9DINO|nr:unnamed protein product [Cladocopium goreaui]
MAESTTQEGNAKCVMCGHGYGSAQGRQHGRSFKCWNCLNVEQTIRRHLGMTADLAEFSQAETENFFREAKSAKGTEGKVIAKGESVAVAEQEALKLCRESRGKAQEWIRAAKETVRLQDQNKEKGEDAQEALVALPCDASDVKVLLKQSTEAQKSLRESFPQPKAKAKAEATGVIARLRDDGKGVTTCRAPAVKFPVAHKMLQAVKLPGPKGLTVHCNSLSMLVAEKVQRSPLYATLLQAAMKASQSQLKDGRAKCSVFYVNSQRRPREWDCPRRHCLQMALRSDVSNLGEAPSCASPKLFVLK